MRRTGLLKYTAKRAQKPIAARFANPRSGDARGLRITLSGATQFGEIALTRARDATCITDRNGAKTASFLLHIAQPVHVAHSICNPVENLPHPGRGVSGRRSVVHGQAGTLRPRQRRWHGPEARGAHVGGRCITRELLCGEAYWELHMCISCNVRSVFSAMFRGGRFASRIGADANTEWPPVIGRA